MQGPRISRDEARRFDRYAIETLGVPSIVLMENAARGCLEVLLNQESPGPYLVCCGKGNNAGDGFALARLLRTEGREVRVALFAAPSELAGDALLNYEVLTRLNVPILDASVAESEEALATALGAMPEGWIIDALLGTGATGAPRPPLDAAIRWMNAQGASRLAVDLPSGLDCDTGEPADPTVRADVTVTMVAPKLGFNEEGARPLLGDCYVVDIGAPFDATVSSWDGGLANNAETSVTGIDGGS
ncbi:Bifunctional NAD(P)H-hydrate repair enzyme Nnr [Pirellulimonas nuda]|uniref:NAD(P)H-hydrate epimerase n=1 Tax=Pirellulimonas nuda TaxID=2528009 RepID=A0A518DA07_9BACT|nr:NAD(P)H-hydrate epimerase [Pirellulimonas nuda]QDU88321.1 Bifunctional NAD(P)H-hydrate repair enzyme Nnr [Pirellulimonas nuda]